MKIKPIPGFPDYLISKNGIVYSVAKRANRGRPKEPIIMSLWKCFGYPSVRLQKDGKGYKKFVHRLVLETFIGPCPNRYECRHLDDNKENNNLDNLKWGTRKENRQDMYKNGKGAIGEKHGMCRLTINKVLKIRRLAKKNLKQFDEKRENDIGSGYRDIAKKFGVSPSAIGHVVRRSTWGWVK